jgi:hypothetical protein
MGPSKAEANLEETLPTFQLRNGSSVNEVACKLIEHKIPIYDIGPLEQTLEGFYLSLMRNDGNLTKTKGTQKG